MMKFIRNFTPSALHSIFNDAAQFDNDSVYSKISAISSALDLDIMDGRELLIVNLFRVSIFCSCKMAYRRKSFLIYKFSNYGFA